jgi:hypothetical protein
MVISRKARGPQTASHGAPPLGQEYLAQDYRRTTKPTTGSVESGGRVSALLELGIGFHPDFSGRQNVCMAAQLRVMSSDEISAKMRETEDFAEIGNYINRYFSSKGAVSRPCWFDDGAGFGHRWRNLLICKLREGLSRSERFRAGARLVGIPQSRLASWLPSSAFSSFFQDEREPTLRLRE